MIKCSLDSQTSEYISTIVLDNEKHLINEVLEVLTGGGTFTSTSKQPRICYNEQVKKVYARRFVTFYLLLGSSIQCLLSVGIRGYLTQGNVCRKIEQMYLSIMEEYFSVEVTHTIPITLMNNAPPLNGQVLSS